ncbi:hypothetical protein LJC17_03455 [Acholeplasma sp. OttesenSCG-928-E16]|nr:hypothetical protein [Acholeplasma sp. OttesenSCG-928-E16]
MKIKHSIFKKLTGEPDVVQDINGRKLEIYWMDKTPYHKQYTSQGRFSLWTSNGKEYKLLIDKGYYEAIPEIYSPKTSVLWVNYLELMGKTQFKYNLVFYSAALVIIAVVVLLAILLQEQMIALIGLIVVLILSMVQNGILRKKVQTEGDRLQYNLMNEVSEEVFRDVINRQQAYYNNFFQKNTVVENNTQDNDSKLLDNETEITEASEELETLNETETVEDESNE